MLAKIEGTLPEARNIDNLPQISHVCIYIFMHAAIHMQAMAKFKQTVWRVKDSKCCEEVLLGKHRIRVREYCIYGRIVSQYYSRSTRREK